MKKKMQINKEIGDEFKVLWNAKIIIFSFLKMSDICKD
jgi:hypothetical protein